MAWTIAALICCVLHAFGFSCSAAASLAESLTGAGKQTSYCNVAAHHQDATDAPARLEYSALACYARRNMELLQPRSDRARAQIDRTQPRAALGGPLQYALLQARDVWSGLDSRSHSWPICRIPDVVRLAVTLNAPFSTFELFVCRHIDRRRAAQSIGLLEVNKMTS